MEKSILKETVRQDKPVTPKKEITNQERKKKLNKKSLQVWKQK